MRFRAFGIALVASIAAVAAHAQTPAPAPLRVIAFDGGWNLPIWAAQRQGFFEANGIAVQLSYTPSSAFLVQSLFDGKSDLATAAIDNLIAYQEGQGEAKIPDNPDLFAFIGCDSGFATVVASPAIKTFAGLKGKTISVDAMTTGYAFVVRELVTRNGLTESDVSFVRAGGTANRYKELLAGKHDATLLRTPFELLAGNRSFNVLASAEALGAYFREHDMPVTGNAKTSLFRINRDIRFSNDKSPYKTHVAAVFPPAMLLAGGLYGDPEISE